MPIRTKDHFFLVCLALLFVTAAVYWPITNYPFILLDDEQYVTANPHVTTGLSHTNLVWAFTTGEQANWHPLTWISHQMDCRMFGLNAGGHHFVNLLFHVANTLLLLLFLRSATGMLWRPALVAAFFAWHPLHVESVAWVSERKDMLSTFFWLLTLLAWLGYASKPTAAMTGREQNGRRIAYVLALAFFVCGLMSKPMVVTLPFVLLLMDLWPLGRIGFDGSKPVKWAWLILEKIPFFILAAAGSVVTYMVQASGGAVWETSLGGRLANAAVAYARYIGKIFWPSKLAIIYSPANHWSPAIVVGAVVLLVLCTGIFLACMRRRPYLLVGWLWFLGTLVPTIGIIQVGAQSMADRYTYIPSIGFFIMLVWGWTDLVGTRPAGKNVSLVIAVMAAIACLMATSVQIMYWFNDTSLFVRAVEVSPDSYVAANCLGKTFEKAGHKSQALAMYRKAVELEPHFPQSQFNYAMSLFANGQSDEAVTHLEVAAHLERGDAGIQHDLGLIFIKHNSFINAFNCFSNVLVLQPNSAEGHFNMACTLANLGQFAPAATEFREALKLQPDYPQAKAQFDHLLTDHPELH